MAEFEQRKYTQKEYSTEGWVSFGRGLFLGIMAVGVGGMVISSCDRSRSRVEETILNLHSGSVKKISDGVYESRDRNFFGPNGDSGLKEGDQGNFETGCRVVGRVEIRGDKYILSVQDAKCTSGIK